MTRIHVPPEMTLRHRRESLCLNKHNEIETDEHRPVALKDFLSMVLQIGPAGAATGLASGHRCVPVSKRLIVNRFGKQEAVGRGKGKARPLPADRDQVPAWLQAACLGEAARSTVD
ncbi:hypothetical protein QPR87_18610 [Paracoccus sp. SSJ]|nr:hypothetical protein [Paracoccus sp. SSJ]